MVAADTKMSEGGLELLKRVFQFVENRGYLGRVTPILREPRRSRHESECDMSNQVGRSLRVALLLLVVSYSNLVTAEEDVPAMIRGSHTLRDKLLRDPHRPGYHFAILDGIGSPFDVNGAIF